MKPVYAGATPLTRGQAIRLARARRVRKIRRRVIAGVVVLFIAVWLVIATVLVSGHDPALASKSTQTSAASTQTTSSSGGTSNSTSATSSGGTSSAATSTPTAVTTQQS